MISVLDVSRFDSFRTIAWRSSRYLLAPICSPHDPEARPGALRVLAAGQAWLECGSALGWVSAGWCVAAYLKLLVRQGSCGEEGLAGAGKHSRRSIIQPRACLGCRVNHHKKHFKVKPNFWAKSCLSALAGCQKTRVQASLRTGPESCGCCKMKLSVSPPLPEAQARESSAYVTPFSMAQSASPGSKSVISGICAIQPPPDSSVIRHRGPASYPSPVCCSGPDHSLSVWPE